MGRDLDMSPDLFAEQRCTQKHAAATTNNKCYWRLVPTRVLTALTVARQILKRTSDLGVYAGREGINGSLGRQRSIGGVDLRAAE